MNDDVLSYLLYLLVVIPDYLTAAKGRLNEKNPAWKKAVVLMLCFLVLCPILLFFAWITSEIISIAVIHGGFGSLTPTSCRFLLVLVIILSGYLREPVIHATNS